MINRNQGARKQTLRLWLGFVVATLICLVPRVGRCSGVLPRLNEVVSANITGLPDEFEPDFSNCPVADCEQWYRDLGSSVFDGQYPDWIEIYNPGDDPIAMTGYGLSDAPDEPFKWVFPVLTLPPKGFLVVFASGKNKVGEYANTNFRLSSGGETIVLTAPSGEKCDEVVTGRIPLDCSLGRLPDQPGTWAWFDQPTPGQSNSPAVFPGFQGDVRLSMPAGVYAAPIQVELTTKAPGSVIHYTLDGHDPGPNSDTYSTPLAIELTTVVKARAFVANRPATPVATATYLVGETSSFAIVSLSINPENLWDPDLGIYTPGRNANEAQRIANYWKDWERPVHVEFFEPGGQPGFALDAALRIYGWGSRANPQKSLAIMLRDQYGVSKLDYALFPELPVMQFESFVLRAGGSDAVARGAFFRDQFATSLLETRQVDVQAFRPAIVYLNGEYWGIQDVREKLNEAYLASHHNVKPDAVDIVSRYWRRSDPLTEAGNDQAYRELEAFLATSDMAAASTYEHVGQVFDLENFVDYLASQIYFANFDWPGNNNKLWRPREQGGRWRWLMYDLDYTFSFDPSRSDYTHDTLAHATLPDGTGWPNPSWTTFTIRKFLEIPKVRTRFVNRMADLLNEDFVPERVLAQIDKFEALYEPAMPAQIARWAGTGDVIPSLPVWKNNIDRMRNFAQQRPAYVRQHLLSHFELGGTQDVSAVIDPPGSGRLKLNSLLIQEPSWKGTYFQGVPVQLDVLPAPGFQFVGWDGLPDADLAKEPRREVTPDGPLHVVAHFEPAVGAVNAIVINEINYASPATDDPGDWVELYNAYSVPVDISGWSLKDQQESHTFVFPDDTILWPGGFLVLCADSARFQAHFPAVTNRIGNLGFGLGNEGDQVRLYDARKALINRVAYAQVDPWPQAPNGSGPTLCLKSPELDNALAASWGASDVPFGSPGAANRTADPEKGSPCLVAWLNGAKVEFRFTAASNREYVLQSSQDLVNWAEWQHVAGTGADVTLSVTPERASKATFFRIQVLQ
jgi:hypothetical protein